MASLAEPVETGSFFHEYKSEAVKKPRLDYQKMIDKVQKTINGDDKPMTSPIYKAARPHHKYQPDQIGMRVLYSEVCRK